MTRKNISILAVVLTVWVFGAVSTAYAKGHGVNCKEQYAFSQRKIEVTADVLKKISGSVKLDPQIAGQVDKWTTVALAQEGALCNAYRQADEATFSTSLYLEQLDKLRQWDESFLEMVLKYVSACDTKDKKGDATAEVNAVKTDLQRLINNLPQVQVPKRR